MLRVIFLPKMSNRLIATIRILGASVTDSLFVAFSRDLHFGHIYRLSFVSLSTAKNCSSASPNVHSLLLGSGKLKVNISSCVSLR